MNCLRITFKLKYYITWRTYVVGTPTNLLFWPVSIIFAIVKRRKKGVK